MPFPRKEERRSWNGRVDCAHSERNCSSSSTATGRDDTFGNVSGLAGGLKRKNTSPETHPEAPDTCSKLENIQEQLKDLSLRLHRLEDKVGSDLEGIYEILKSSKGTMNDNLRDSVV